MKKSVSRLPPKAPVNDALIKKDTAKTIPVVQPKK